MAPENVAGNRNHGRGRRAGALRRLALLRRCRAGRGSDGFLMPSRCTSAQGGPLDAGSKPVREIVAY